MLEAEARTRQTELIRGAFREAIKGVSTSIPGHVLTFNPLTQLAQVQVGVARVDINGAEFKVPPIIEVPVYFPGGDFCVEYQIDPGCEGDILFSQRCIDGWIQSGGIAANPIGRFHNMQDAMFLPGFRSQPNVLPEFQNNGVRMRNKAGTQFVWLKNDNSISMDNGVARFNVLADGTTLMQNGAGMFQLLADGSFLINGLTITPDGNIITAAGINLNTHRHSGVTPGSGNSGVPVI
ncbi:Gp138 family membrane-puncturing spike protein [Pseudomonas qingdaonensis]|uniref:Gp138 family membrane-puncturing spike protein n=1 Tax=Pseudomonas qingdaonensis TaxID=2056231 RepID=UPI00265E3F21|nr:Gp138 family membrane-puncturing spike protein [Pseudomonas qingdaonensis]WKL65460.1 Gp138 family membrane-puncturing spike protein [Pseudomonas qingdaonensis]